MINVKCNFSSRYEDLSCDLCNENELQTQEHLLNCSKIIKNCPQLYNNRIIQYSDIFGKVKKQHKAVQLFSEILKIKEKLEENDETQ